MGRGHNALITLFFRIACTPTCTNVPGPQQLVQRLTWLHCDTHSASPHGGKPARGVARTAAEGRLRAPPAFCAIRSPQRGHANCQTGAR